MDTLHDNKIKYYKLVLLIPHNAYELQYEQMAADLGGNQASGLYCKNFCARS